MALKLEKSIAQNKFFSNKFNFLLYQALHRYFGFETDTSSSKVKEFDNISYSLIIYHFRLKYKKWHDDHFPDKTIYLQC